MAEETVSKRGRPVGTRTATVELETLSFKVPVELKARLQAYAKQRRQSISELIREGVEWRIGEGDPLHMRYGTVASGETAYTGNTGNTQEGEVDVKFLRGMLDELRQLRGAIQAWEKRLGEPGNWHAPIVTGNTGITYEDGDIPVASRKAQRASRQTRSGDGTREGMPSYDPAKHHLGKLCPGQHEWGTTGQSLRNADNQCLECKAQAKRDKRKAKREAQLVAG